MRPTTDGLSDRPAKKAADPVKMTDRESRDGCHCYVRTVRLRRTDSTDEIDADFEISVSDGSPAFSLTIESSGGATGSGTVRNPEYPLLLEELLRRLSALDVELVDAFVDSRRVAQLPVADRRIHVDGTPFPIPLARVQDFGVLRRGLTRPQGDIGSARSVGGGNRRKRATLAFRASTTLTRADLVAALNATEPGARVRKSGIAAGVSEAHLETALAAWRRLGRDGFLAQYRAPAARKYVVIDRDDEIDAMALLFGARVIAGLEIGGSWRGDRENVVVPLRRLGFAIEDLDLPSEGPLGPNPQSYVGLAERLGGTDVAVRRMGRREQRFLRGALGIATGDPNAVSPCGMCGREYPHSFLVAAHIKPRHACSDQERLDLPHVGWALCVAGCDALFEQGYVGVDENGHVVPLNQEHITSAAVSDLIGPLTGTRAPGWTAERAKYFAAHRGRHDGTTSPEIFLA